MGCWRQPGTGETNFPYLFHRLDAPGYGGWIGCECKPANGTAAGLGWFEDITRRDREVNRRRKRAMSDIGLVGQGIMGRLMPAHHEIGEGQAAAMAAE